MTALCAAPRCRLDQDGNPEPRQVAGQAYLCAPCRSRLRRDVEALPGLWQELGYRLVPSQTRGEPVGGSKDPNLALNFAVAEHRSHIAGVLASWCLLVGEERGLNPPAGMDVSRLAAWLTTHVDWLAHQPFADEPAREFRELAGRARAMAYPRRRREFTLPESCPCGGTLGAMINDDDDLLPAAIECDTCDNEWQPSEWLALGRRIHGSAA